MTGKTSHPKGKGWHRVSCQKCLSRHKTDARRKRNIYHTETGAKYQERSAGKTLSVVTGHGVIIAALPLEASDMGSCVRIDLNHLSMHEHSRRRDAEKVSKKNESQRWVKGEIDELLMFVIILRVRNIFISPFPPRCWWSRAQPNGLTSSVQPRINSF